jgi:hypothetical protein
MIIKTLALSEESAEYLEAYARAMDASESAVVSIALGVMLRSVEPEVRGAIERTLKESSK